MPMRLDAARVNAQLSQQEAADRLGISRNTLSNYENYNTKPSIEMGEKIASLYGTTVDRIKWSAE